MCPWRPPLYSQGGTGPVFEYSCECPLIARVRADERDDAAKRVRAVLDWASQQYDKSPVSAMIVEAARGEDVL